MIKIEQDNFAVEVMDTKVDEIKVITITVPPDSINMKKAQATAHPDYNTDSVIIKIMVDDVIIRKISIKDTTGSLANESKLLYGNHIVQKRSNGFRILVISEAFFKN